MPKLTKRIIEGITRDPHKPLKIWDTEIKCIDLFQHKLEGQ